MNTSKILKLVTLTKTEKIPYVSTPTVVNTEGMTPLEKAIAKMGDRYCFHESKKVSKLAVPLNTLDGFRYDSNKK